MADGPLILVVEDEPAIAAGIVRGLRKAGLRTTLAVDGDAAIAAFARESPDLVVLDLNLPMRDGFSVLEAWSGRMSTPIIVLSARVELEDRLRSFGLGAADYMPKPFFMDELVARIRSRLNLVVAPPPRRLRVGGIDVDLSAREVLRDGAPLDLTAAEFNVLVWLAARPRRAVTRADLVQHALPIERGATERTVDTHVARLRKKLGPEGSCFVTVWGIGYRYDPPAE